MRDIIFNFVVILLLGHGSALPATLPARTGTCWAMGDPHYRTFDGHYYTFMGNCTYIMAKNCQVNSSLPAFEVQAWNKNSDASQMTSVGMVIVQVYGISLGIVRGERGFVRVDGVTKNLPFYFENNLGKVKLFLSGLLVVMETDFGLTVQYDWEQYLAVTVPNSFMGKLCGLCGNFNGDDGDDLLTPSGTLAESVATLGKSWRIPGLQRHVNCRDECTGCSEQCELSLANDTEAEVFCGILTKVTDGPFSECGALIDPKIYYRNCKYDFCRGKRTTKHHCETLQVYSDACQRAGVQVGDWRNITGCPKPECPENSHFERCGAACPATCEDPSASRHCKASCVEACVCNQGYLLSGIECVPEANCGCQYNGSYLQAGESFWADENCNIRCSCMTEGYVQSQETSCPFGKQCQVINGTRDCYSVSFATCMVLGDHHYLTFDGKKHNFHGTCVYQLAGVCSDNAFLEPFKVLVRNDGQDKEMGTMTKLIEVNAYGYAVVISKKHSGMVMVNHELTHLPVTLGENQVQIHKSGYFVVIKTDFGVQVSFDWGSVAIVTVPSNYAGAMCGLCGNYNHMPNDDLLRKDGMEAATSEELGQSWLEAEPPGCVHGCNGPCPDCDFTQKLQYATNQYCGLLKDPSGPFRDCHSVVDPNSFFQDCLYDVCLYKGSRNMQCKSLAAYTAACQGEDVAVYQWRSATFCNIQCPVNSHYDVCADGCPMTCMNVSTSFGCMAHCKEGCACNDGFLLSGDQCVPLADCGCQYKSGYYKNGQVFYPDGQCHEECTCNGTVTCKAFSCGAYEKCVVTNSVRSCQPLGYAVCSISGDHHYKTFDNAYYDFHGTCKYTAAQACELQGSRLIPFSVAVENEKWDAQSNHPDVSAAKRLAVEVYGYTLTLQRNQAGSVMVNSAMANLPINLGNGMIQVYRDGTNDVISTDFGLKVTNDLVYHVTINLPSAYHGKTCGLCGNFNRNKTDDLQMPDGETAKDINSFGAAWKVSVPGAVCEDGCSGDVCPQCDETKRAVIEADCGIISHPEGPFAACHDAIDPASYVRNCAFDVCVSGGERNSSAFANDASWLCRSISAYMTDCQDIGIAVKSWRTPTFCPLSCPADSHYQLCARTCDTPCPGLTDIITCPDTCAEGCACNTGYYFNGTGCVPDSRCSCYVDGHTMKIGETVVSGGCSKSLRCQLFGMVLALPLRCKSDETCQVRNGVEGCHPKQCVMKSGGFLLTFSGIDFAISAAGAFDVVKVCDSSFMTEWFRVVVDLQHCGKANFKTITGVRVFFEGLAIEINQLHETWVNGENITLPKLLRNDVSAHVSDNTVVIEKVFGVRVSYILSQEVTVSVRGPMASKICGACGKLSGNPVSEWSVQEKSPAVIRQYMANWMVPDFSSCGV